MNEKQARRVVTERSNDLCEIRTKVCTGRAMHVHHVLRRSHGGKNDPELLLHLCPSCHDYLHAHPAEAYERGWLIRGVR